MAKLKVTQELFPISPNPATGKNYLSFDSADGSLKSQNSSGAVTDYSLGSANMAQSTIKGRAAGAGTGAPTDLSATQATAILNEFVGDSGSGGTKGLVKVPSTGDSGKLLKGDGTWSSLVNSVGITIDGGGATITTGVKGYIEVPYACTINRVTMLADQSGSIVVDIWKAAYSSYPPLVANTITASALPTITTALKSQDSTLTGWTVAIAAGDILAFNVNSATSITRVHLILKVTRT